MKSSKKVIDKKSNLKAVVFKHGSIFKEFNNLKDLYKFFKSQFLCDELLYSPIATFGLKKVQQQNKKMHIPRLVYQDDFFEQIKENLGIKDDFFSLFDNYIDIYLKENGFDILTEEEKWKAIAKNFPSGEFEIIIIKNDIEDDEIKILTLLNDYNYDPEFHKKLRVIIDGNTIIINGVEMLFLTEEPCIGSYNYQSVERRNIYETTAIDKFGNDYKVIWDIKEEYIFDDEDVDGSDMCDWETISEIRAQTCYPQFENILENYKSYLI